MKRVVLFRNGTTTNGKMAMITHSIQELLTTASQKFNINARIAYCSQGGEIDDVKFIRDDDIIYVSEGEPFILPQNAKSAAKSKVIHPDWILLNVGGKNFATSRQTLTTKDPDSMLARMFADEEGIPKWPTTLDNNGAVLIDRSPLYFEPILNYLRHGQIILDKNVNPLGVIEEAKFYGVESIIPELESQVEKNPDHKPLTRRDVIDALIRTPHTSELRFQGVNLAGADLSRLDLRNINFKYAIFHRAKLTGANLSYCCLERADLSYANLEGSVLLDVKMLCANLEGANMRSCNMENPAGTKANLEGANLKGADLEGSQMAGVNLRVATLKKANLQNCHLRGAVMAGSDLENCNLSGSDLNEANLRGANLKDTAFELMLTPLHMAQAIR
ncbi:KCTD9 [Cordylochernes scorpioides]|uniref:KCTD9 n=1 Tax=Cordylochernes scorpioides TaxID=51811 RepID=A0ABY6K725_9ARAC|nr:KCTD9 [Cordylochernes scorpioides]